MIELIRRFKPAVYDIVAVNSLTLTGNDAWLRGGSYHSDEKKKRIPTGGRFFRGTSVDGKGIAQARRFLRKLSNTVKTVSTQAGRAWIDAAMADAKDLTYDRISGFGEAGHILRMVLQLALTLPKPQRLAFLEKCIEEATDDTMSFGILTTLTANNNDFNLEISFADLYPSFIRRMRRRYGRESDAEHADITTSDAAAFNLWGMQSLPKYNVKPTPKIALSSTTSGGAISGTAACGWCIHSAQSSRREDFSRAD